MPAIKRLAFDELLPDLPFVGETNGMAECKNVLPVKGRWRPTPKASEVASGATTFGGNELIVGAGYSHARKKVILGTSGAGIVPSGRADLYEISGSSIASVRKSGGYGATDPEIWSMAEFDSFFIATQVEDPVQYIDDSAATFVDLITSTTKPQAKFCCTAKTHLVLAWVNESSTNYPRRVWWSGQGDPQMFDVGTERAGFFDLAAGDGEIIGLVGAEDFFIVFTEGKVVLCQYVGGAEVWFPVEIGSGPECLAVGGHLSIVKRGGAVYYRGRDGYKVVAGGQIMDVGEGKVRSYVRDAEFDFGFYNGTGGVVDGSSGLIAWLGEFGLEGGSEEGSVLIMSPTEGRFSLLDDVGLADDATGKQFIVPVAVPSPGDASSDTLSGVYFLWTEGSLPGIYNTIKAARLTGATLAAWSMKSRLIEPDPGSAGMIGRVRPVIELEEGAAKAPPNVSVEVRLWNDLFKKQQAGGSPVTLDTDTDLNSEGWMVSGLPASAQRFEVILSGEESDSAAEYVPINIVGVDAEFDKFAER